MNQLGYVRYQGRARIFLTNTYTLFDGLTYNTRGYFVSCVVFFRAPWGRKNTRNEQMSNVRSYYMLNHQIRDLIFHQFLYFLVFWILVFEIHLASYRLHNMRAKDITTKAKPLKCRLFDWLKWKKLESQGQRT